MTSDRADPHLQYISTSIVLLDALLDFFEMADNESCQSVLISRFGLCSISPSASKTLLALPFTTAKAFIIARFGEDAAQRPHPSLGDASGAIADIVAQMGITTPEMAGVSCWLWKSFSILLRTPQDFYSLGLLQLLSSCLAFLAPPEQGADHLSDSFEGLLVPTGGQSLQQSLDAKVACLQVLSQTSRILSDMRDSLRDAQLRAIIDDCGLFILEKIVQFQLPIGIGTRLLQLAAPQALQLDPLLKCFNLWRRLAPCAELLTSMLRVAMAMAKDDDQAKVSRSWQEFCKLLQVHDSQNIPVEARLRLVALSPVVGYTPSFLSQEMVPKVLLAAQAQGLDIGGRVPAPAATDIDDLSGALFRLRHFSATSHLQVAESLNCLESMLGHYPRDNLQLPQVKRQVQEAIGSEECIAKACCYVASRGGHIIPSLYLSHEGAIIDDEAFWFWLCCNASGPLPEIWLDKLAGVEQSNVSLFAPTIAHALLEHHSGHRKSAQSIIDALKAWLSQSGFESNFKAHLTRICAYCLLLGERRALDQQGRR